ncbi:MAG: 16S rRNA (cytosine(967)-C(5))-methyltransferase, partial [Halioglobus sp.]|nr:16S rRNA (cytosine(967)-C(5))-methyltransferase [Halioglobus sp.]
AAQLAALLLAAAPGDRVLDACAAPGGKACHILELQPQLAQLVAMDSDAQRLQRVEENLERLQLPAALVCADAAQPPPALAQEPFDHILVDAPCSAAGVIRRHPDIKLLRRHDDIDRFAALQLAIMEALWPLLRPGGTLLYATCSVLRQENSDVVARCLQVLPGCSVERIDAHWGEAVEHGRQLLPTEGEHDGLFYARLRKAH